MTQATTPDAAETGQSGHDTGFIDDPRDLGSRILRWKELGYHVLSPAIKISNFAPGYGVNASLVLLDPNIDPSNGGGTDVYWDKNTMNGKGDNRDGSEQRAPSKIGLMKIAAAIGVSWVNPYGRVDPLTIQNLWIYNVTGVYLAYDGTPQVIKGEKEIDYRDGSAQIGEWSRDEWRKVEERNAKLDSKSRQTHINGWSDRRVRMARTNGAERAETGALERAIRTLGIKHMYTIAELRHPFVALRVCPMVDMNDADVRQQVTAGMLGGVAKLYAHVQQRALPEAREVERFTVDTTARREPETVSRHELPHDNRSVVAAPISPQVKPAVTDTELPPAAPQPVRPAQQPQASAPAVQPPYGTDPHAAGAEHEPDLPKGAVYLADCRKEEIAYSKTHAKFGQKFTKWRVTDSNGEESVTIFSKWGSIIDKAYREGLAVVMVTARGKEFRGVAELEIQNIKIAAGEADEPSDVDGMRL